MNDVLPFENPPITEAIFDIRVIHAPDISVENFLPFYEKIKKNYPIKIDRHSLQGGFQFKPGSAPEYTKTSDKIDGYFFHSDDRKRIVQARLDGYTFNMLKPYTKWEDFSKQAFDLWNQYIEIVKPVNVTRLALRYINVIDFPLPFLDFKEYILTTPEIAPKVPQGLSSFFTRLVIPNADINAQAIVTETMDEKNIKSGKLPFVLDIDVFKDVSLLANSIEIQVFIEELRNYKNQIFLNSLTDKTKELFK